MPAAVTAQDLISRLQTAIRLSELSQLVSTKYCVNVASTTSALQNFSTQISASVWPKLKIGFATSIPKRPKCSSYSVHRIAVLIDCRLTSTPKD